MVKKLSFVKGGYTMPGFDGTGPFGQGPGTGGGRGLCSISTDPNLRGRGAGRGNIPWGGGRGRVFGGGRGRNRFSGASWQNEELTVLQNLAAELEQRLAAVKKRMDTLSGQQSS